MLQLDHNILNGASTAFGWNLVFWPVSGFFVFLRSATQQVVRKIGNVASYRSIWRFCDEEEILTGPGGVRWTFLIGEKIKDQIRTSRVEPQMSGWSGTMVPTLGTVHVDR